MYIPMLTLQHTTKKTRKPLIPNPSWITRYCETSVEINPTEFCGRKITHTIWIDDHVMLVQGYTGRHESQKDFYCVFSSQHRYLSMVDDMFFSSMTFFQFPRE